MTGVPLQQMADRVAELMEARLGLRGAGLAEKLRKGRRVLPRRVAAAAETLAAGAAMAQNPKLLLQVDQEALAAAYDLCLKHLNGVDGRARRRGGVVNMLATSAFYLLVVAAALVGVLVWRGFL